VGPRPKPRTLDVSLMALMALLIGCAGGPRGPFNAVPGSEGEGEPGAWVYSGQYRRTYTLAGPDSLDEAESYPLLVMLHGAGGTADGLRRWTGMDTVAAAAGYFTVFPEGLDSSWDVGCGGCTSAGLQGVDDVRFIETLVRQLAEAYPVDTARVFLAGHSLGAQFVHHYACEASLAPAGIAAVSGLWLRRSAVACSPKPPLAVLMIHGDRDPVLPWDGPRDGIGALPMPVALERWTELLACDGPAEVTDRQAREREGTGVTTTLQRGCPRGAAVVLHRIRGGGHGWPGASRSIRGLGPASPDLDGVEEILSFFEPYAHPQPASRPKRGTPATS